MTALSWDDVGDRRYETGVDRGVLFMQDGRAIPWNGLTGVEDATSSEVQAYFMDGVKFLERQIPGDYSGTLKALTYPEEFNEVLGNKVVHEGLSYHDQPPQQFHLCYRTKIGNDVDGLEHGYRIHILYNLRAVPSTRSFGTLGDNVQPTEFNWSLSGTPPVVSGYRPTVHISIDSTNTDVPRLQDIEELLYGTDTTNPELPTLDEITALFDEYNNLYITDNGDGTWTATDAGNDFITMDSETEFTISHPELDAEYLDADTYIIDTTTTD